MRTLSEFFSLYDGVGAGLGVLGGASLGDKYSRRGKSRTELAKNVGVRSLGLGALHTAVDASANKGKNIKQSIGRGLKTAGLYGGTGTVSSQLAYRNKYKKQFDNSLANKAPRGVLNKVNQGMEKVAKYSKQNK